jgi:hypothetical protein
MRTVFVLLTALSCSGCIGFAVWPCVDVTPPVNVGAEDVEAKRCDVKITGGQLAGLRGRRDVTPQLIDSADVHGGQVDRQTQFRAGCWAGLLYGYGYEHHDFKLVLHRNGYEDVEVPSWPWWCVPGYSSTRTVEWKKRPDADSDPLKLRLPGAFDGLLPEVKTLDTIP